MNFQICTGNKERTGVTKRNDIISFSIQASPNSVCQLLLYPRGGSSVIKVPMKVQGNYDTTYMVGIKELDWKNYDYNFEVNGEEITDVYARKISGREIWADEARRPIIREAEPFIPKKERKRLEQEGLQKYGISEDEMPIEGKKIKSSFYFSDYKWNDSDFPGIRKEDMIIYKLHVRGFSMGMKGNSRGRGTVEVIERKLNYFKEMGVTSLMFMPVYEFEEIIMLDKSKSQSPSNDMINYWGYTIGSYFAPKSSYLGKDYNPDNFKRLIDKMHQKQMECILEFYFTEKTNPHLIIDVLHYWHIEYHVDGFRIIGNPQIAELLMQDIKLSRCKLLFESFRKDLAQEKERFGPELLSYNDGFLYGVRKMINHQNGNLHEFACQMRRQQSYQGFINYIAENNGFTLWDSFSYEYKHNEQNGEENRDGNDWNYSSNCGQEGFSRKRQVNDLRKRKIKNAFAALFLAQGIPLIWMGDECTNTQGGNNNAYCQDNGTGWKDWKSSAAGKQILSFVSQLAQLRKKYPVLHSPKPYQLLDYENRGCPDLSYHGDSGWKIDFDRNKGYIGMFYCGMYAGSEENLYVAYNFQHVSQKFALPKGMDWNLILDTSREPSIIEPEKLGDIREVEIEGQSVCLLSGKQIWRHYGRT